MLTGVDNNHMFGLNVREVTKTMGSLAPLNTPKIEREAANEAAQQALVETSKLRDVNGLSLEKLYNINIEMSDTSGTCIYCIAFSPDSKFLAATTSDGMAQIFDHRGLFCWKCNNGDKLHWPVTACVWRPVTNNLPTPSVLVTGSVRGDIAYWHTPSQRQIFKMTERGNQINTLSYRPDGMMLATAGKDHTVRTYDEQTKTMTNAFDRGVLHHTGHSNRVFASKWKKDDPNILLTGGWDSSVMIWDLRCKAAVRAIFGPHIAGEALDIQNETILTGSWRAKDPIETWDFGTGKRLSYISDTSMIYTAKFLLDREGFCVAGGSGRNELRIYNLSDPMQKSDPITIDDGDQAGIYSCDISDEDRPRVAVSGGSTQIRVCQIREGMSKKAAIKD